MSNRNFDHRVIIQRLQDKNYARNLYKNNTSGQRIITNPQNSNGNSSKFITYNEGSQTNYYKGLLGGNVTIDIGGTVNIPPYPGYFDQAPAVTTIDWMTTVGGSDSILLNLTTDSNNNVYVNGIFSTSSTFVNNFQSISNGVVQTSLYGSIQSQPGAVFTSLITKYAPTGQALWTTSIYGNNTGSSRQIGNMDIDSQGNLYVTGFYTTSSIINNFNSISSGYISTSDFGLLPGFGDDDIFVAKYNTSGSALWATRVGGLISDTPWGLTSDSSGNVYVLGQYQNSTIIDSYTSISSGIISTTAFGTLVGFGGNDICLIKLNASGIVQWATNIGGVGSDNVGGISIDSSGNVYVGGAFTVSSIFNSYAAVSSGVISTTTFGTLPGVAGTEGFIAKYSPAGIIQWATSITGTNAQRQWDLDVDSQGNVYATGSYLNSSFINSYAGISSGIISTSLFGRLPVTVSGQDAFVIKYNTLGTVQWATNIGGTGLDTGYTVAIDPYDNINVGGLFTATSSFMNSYSTISSGIILTSTFGRLLAGGTGVDAYLAQYNTSGILRWATLLDGAPTTNVSQWGLTTDSLGNIYACGSFISSLFVNAYSTVSSNVIITSSIGELQSMDSVNRMGYLVRYNSNGTILIP